MKVDIEKAWINDKGDDIPAKNMDDYIDIGAFAADSKNVTGRSVVNQLYLHKYKLTAGMHTITFSVTGKPQKVGVDPYNKLIDRQPNDNMKDL